MTGKEDGKERERNTCILTYMCGCEYMHAYLDICYVAISSWIILQLGSKLVQKLYVKRQVKPQNFLRRDEASHPAGTIVISTRVSSLPKHI